MTISDIFAEYYTQYRGDDETPTTSDTEWKVFLRYANAAIARWENVDGVLWRELWKKDDSITISSGTYAYDAPSDFKHQGSYVRLVDPNDSDNYVQLPVKDLSHQYHLTGSYAFFSGNRQDGFKLNFSEQALVDRDNWGVDYFYYKTADRITPSTEDGTFEPEMADPYFIMHHALTNRFRASRNTLGYQTARRDAELALANMQHRNDMGSPHNPWNILDTASGGWGV